MDVLCQYLNTEQCRIYRDFESLKDERVGVLVMRPSFVFEDYCNTTWSFTIHNSSYVKRLYH